MSDSVSAAFVDVTEIAGQSVSVEQVERLCHRYYWAADLCADKDVVEVACGAGQGLGLLAQKSRSILGADISPEVLASARSTYGTTIDLKTFPADSMPLADASVDRIILFEALYYIPDAAKFFAEARRVLRGNGLLLVATANKDLFDFAPSPHSTRYLGVVELGKELAIAGFSASFRGHLDITKISARQKVLRPIKFAAQRLGLMPKTMHGKAWLKRLVFGAMMQMPDRIDGLPYNYHAPDELPANRACQSHKVIYCAAAKLTGAD